MSTKLGPSLTFIFLTKVNSPVLGMVGDWERCARYHCTAGLAVRICDVADIVQLIGVAEPAPTLRGLAARET